ncbi:MAG: hypothetical protein ABIJ81_03475 [Patescibacteria group bacterium]
MTHDPTLTPNQEFKELLEENLKYSKEILKSTEKIRRYILVKQVWTFVKVVVIIGLIVLGVITIRPLLDKAFSTYRELLGTGEAIKDASQGLDAGQQQDLQKLLEQYQKSGASPN